MYNPSTRLLTILELLQIHRTMSGDELARRLEVEPRSIRRYIQLLQDMGIPIESSRGPGGGYHLRKGFSLPPLLFTEDEANALVLALSGMQSLPIDLSRATLEGALSKILRVLPQERRLRTQSLSAHLSHVALPEMYKEDATELLMVSEAIHAARRISLSYLSYQGERSERVIEPYGLVSWRSGWYLVGYCLLRQSMRIFRFDRIAEMHLLDEIFTPDISFDYRAHFDYYALTVPARWEIEIEFLLPFHRMRSRLQAHRGELIDQGETVLYRFQYDQLDWVARFLVGMNLPFRVIQPPELRDALKRLGEELIAQSGLSSTIPEQ